MNKCYPAGEVRPVIDREPSNAAGTRGASVATSMVRPRGLVRVIGALPVAPERHIIGFQIRQLGNRLNGLVGRNLRRRPRVTALRGG